MLPGAAVFAHGSIHFALAPLGWLFIMPMLAQVAEDTRLLALLLETLEGALEILVLVNDYFGQTGSLRVTKVVELLTTPV